MIEPCVIPPELSVTGEGGICATAKPLEPLESKGVKCTIRIESSNAAIFKLTPVVNPRNAEKRVMSIRKR